MIRLKISFVLILYLFHLKLAMAFPWPAEYPGRITSVLGEQRRGRENAIRFHNGVDLGDPYNTVNSAISSIHSGYCDVVTGRVGHRGVFILRERANRDSQLSGYYHVIPVCRQDEYVTGLIDETQENPAITIGWIDEGTSNWSPHLHLIIGTGRGGDETGGSENALVEQGGLNEYFDDCPPQITADHSGSDWVMRFCPDLQENDSDGFGICWNENIFPVTPNGRKILFGKVDVMVKARDWATNVGGTCHEAERMGVYALGWGVEDTRGNIIKETNLENAEIRFNINPHSVYGWRVFTTAPRPPSPAPLTYWVTNTKGPQDLVVDDSYWNTKQGKTNPEADSQKDALYPDGRLQFKACVWDSAGNSNCHTAPVIVDNFKPQIKEFEVQGLGAGLDAVAKIGDTVRVRMRFDQEMDPDYYPELRTKDGTQSLGNVVGQWWEEGPEGVTDTFVTDIELSELDSQQFMKLEVSVSNAKGLEQMKNCGTYFQGRDILR